jgi:hypothetical protein
MASTYAIQASALRKLLAELPFSLMVENVEEIMDISESTAEKTIPPLLSDELPSGVLNEHSLLLKSSLRSFAHHTLSIIPPTSYPENSHDLPASAIMSSSNPFGFVSATDAIAKDRAGRRARPAPRHAGPSRVDDRQDPSVLLSKFFMHLFLFSISYRFASHLTNTPNVVIDMRPFCSALARTRSTSRSILVSSIAKAGE